MLGGGFLRQTNETMKANRDLLGKQKRKPFDRSEHKETGSKSKKDQWKTELSEVELEQLRAKIRLKKKRERQTEIITISILLGVVYLLYRVTVSLGWS
jgi:hypothetical protein